MKKTLTIIGLALIIASCGNNSKPGATDSSTTSSDSSSSKTVSTTTSLPTDTAGAGLIAKNDCQTCHKVNEKLVGPAFADIAKKYTVSAAVIDTLADKIIKGGSGNWGQVPMSPHPALAMGDAQEMVKYILSLK
jgi:cytochrome c